MCNNSMEDGNTPNGWNEPSAKGAMSMKSTSLSYMNGHCIVPIRHLRLTGIALFVNDEYRDTEKPVLGSNRSECKSQYG